MGSKLLIVFIICFPDFDAILNHQDSAGWSPLTLNAGNGETDLVDLLLTHGAKNLPTANAKSKLSGENKINLIEKFSLCQSLLEVKPELFLLNFVLKYVWITLNCPFLYKKVTN